MTERLHDDHLDREIRSFLDWRAEDVMDAPSATEMALRVGSRVSNAPAWPRLHGQLAWVTLAVLLMGLVASAALVSGLLPTRDNEVQRSYEAVFLRLAEAGPEIDVIVVAVNAQGDEREIVHLPTLSASPRYGADGPNAQLGSLAAVSPTGLLALPRTTGNYLFSWEITDLHRPGSAPITVPGIEQDYDARTYDFGEQWARRPVAVWGPGERVAIFMYERTDGSGVFRISMLDGRTGAGTSLPHPEASLLPYWAADGSGLLATSGGASPETQVFRMDGSLVGATAAFANDGHGRRYRVDGTPSGTFADFNPDDYPEGSLELLLTRNEIGLGDVAWTADGAGRWLLVPGFDEKKLRLERLTSDGTAAVMTLQDEAAPTGTVDVGRIVGLAPDDSMVIVQSERFRFVAGPGFESGPRSRTAQVVVPATRIRLEIAGYFAGWLEVSK